MLQLRTLRHGSTGSLSMNLNAINLVASRSEKACIQYCTKRILTLEVYQRIRLYGKNRRCIVACSPNQKNLI